MPKQYSKQEIWDIYDKLPEDLQQAILSAKNADYINSICKNYDIEEDKIALVGRFTGRVLMGLLTPEEFKIKLKEEAGLKPELVENVFRGINRFIFGPVRETLEALYGIEISPLPKPKTPEELYGKEEKQPRPEKPKPEPKKKKPRKKDVYREPIE